MENHKRRGNIILTKMGMHLLALSKLAEHCICLGQMGNYTKETEMAL